MNVHCKRHCASKKFSALSFIHFIFESVARVKSSSIETIDEWLVTCAGAVLATAAVAAKKIKWIGKILKTQWYTIMKTMWLSN